MTIKFSTNFALSMLATLGCLAVLAGCNNNPSIENYSTPPKLSIGSDPADGNATTTPAHAPTANSAAANSPALPATPTTNTATTNTANAASQNQQSGIDPDLQALVDQVRDNVRAWHDGKPFDFNPAARKICQRLETSFNEDNFQFAADAASVCVMTGSTDAAQQIYTTMAKAAAHAPANLAEAVQEISGAGLRRLAALGNRPKLEGTVFGSGPLDWNQYRGRVVLLDFWATWCPNCVAEMPDVRKVFEKYHSQGFEVLGISLDKDPRDLAYFLEEKKLPWPTLFGDNPDKRGWQLPMAEQFGIQELPSLMLVDKSGKIVTISTRIEDLPQLVEKLLAQR